MFNRAVRDIYFNSCLQVSRACNQIIEFTDSDIGGEESQVLRDVEAELKTVEHHLRKMLLLTHEVQKRQPAEQVVAQSELSDSRLPDQPDPGLGVSSDLSGQPKASAPVDHVT